ncbi:3-deoxy-8-phosphooctulonate synthase [bacterium DOLJORAL78_65_58]|nr:MAG: 3-deoxy-8-phosphooctulonate synthase [bacterium DOLZORAL124_64_63]PIE76672.1 MAG: 3-deoxy-8-phosphooctulonate synthase [bacterium DOLJORAL78_65_58]
MSVAKPITLRGHRIGAGQPLYIMAGPCVLEDPDEMLQVAQELAETCDRLGVGYCFKASYTKDNRTSSASYRGPGLEDGLRLLDRIKEAVGVPVLTDIHHPEDADAVAQVAEILQIPAFLCRQTSLLEAAGRTGRIVNIKKGQFLAPEDLRHGDGKVVAAGGRDVLFTERGTFLGYRDLTVDFRGIQIMRNLGRPVVFDATHSVQSPGSTGTTTGGKPELIPLLARCGVSAGSDAVFLEVHPEPARAKSDAGSQMPLEHFEGLVSQLIRFRDLFNEVTG